MDFSISRKFQWIWIRIAKTAGRSIKTALSRADPGMEFVPGRTIAEVYALYPEVRDYRTFAFIRHPFERALSFYADLFLPLTGYPEDWFMAHMMARQALLREFHGLAEVGSFDDYCEWLNTPWASDRHADRHFRSQICAIRLRGGRLPDFIGRLENIDQDFPRFADHVGMPAPALPMLGTRAGWSAAPDAVDFARAAMRAHLTDRNRALLAARYEGDLEVYLSLSAGGPGTSGPVGEAIRT